MVRPAELIEQKRGGGEHDPAALAELILAYARDEVPDYQLAAWCMAVYFRGLTAAETDALTDAMIRSGDTLDLHALLGRKVVDKHSTGGVGDKTSIAVGPIVAACGVPLGKMSGRGLGHTGGTLDKLEAIPGFRVELSTEEFVAQLRDVGTQMRDPVEQRLAHAVGRRPQARNIRDADRRPLPAPADDANRMRRRRGRRAGSSAGGVTHRSMELPKAPPRAR